MLESQEMRKVYCDTMIALAKEDPRIVDVEADLTGAHGMKPFKAAYPDRSFNVGIAEANMVGIAAGPSFVAGFKDVGFSLFIVGALATAIPLVSGLLMAKYLFKFHPALSLGCTAGARTTTAALGAIQDAVESDTPALGYTVTCGSSTRIVMFSQAISISGATSAQ